MTDVGSVAALVERAEVLVSVCPPGSAVAVAAEVAEGGFDGLYVDANAVAPSTARQIGAMFERFVDGGIVGPPARSPGTTRLYVCGAESARVAELFADSPLGVRVLDAPIGAASALKACYASWTKGGAALLFAIRALATAEGVDDALVDEWSISLPGLADQADRQAANFGPKAWRFVDEMRELSVAFATHGLPSGALDAAAETYAALAGLKDAEQGRIGDIVGLLGPDRR